MPNSYLPVPDEFIVWRDNDGRYAIARRPPLLRGNFQSRSKALYWLYGTIGKRTVIEQYQREEQANDA